MKIIELSHGRVCFVDDEDYEWLSKYHWFIEKPSRNPGYAVRKTYANGKSKKIRMHREIMNCPVDMQVDHIDCNSLNNQRSNLRICDRSQNRRNSRKTKTICSSKYKGVQYANKNVKCRKKWYARITFNGKRMFLGVFLTEIEAAKAYNEAALKYHGEFARLNIIIE